MMVDYYYKHLWKSPRKLAHVPGRVIQKIADRGFCPPALTHNIACPLQIPQGSVLWPRYQYNLSLVERRSNPMEYERIHKVQVWLSFLNYMAHFFQWSMRWWPISFFSLLIIYVLKTFFHSILEIWSNGRVILLPLGYWVCEIFWKFCSSAIVWRFLAVGSVVACY